MRIAFITPEYVTEPNFHGGLAKYLHHVSLVLKGLGHQPIIIVATSSGSYLEHDGIPVFRVDTQCPSISKLSRAVGRRQFLAAEWIWQSWKLNRKLLEINRQNKIDLAQFTSYKATAFFCPSSIPSIVRLSSLQGLWDSAYELPKDAARALMHYIELRSLRRADRLISPGWALAKAAEHLTGKQVTTIENPYVTTCSNVDHHVYQDLLEGKEYLLFYGSIGLLKGVKTIADIIHRVLEMHPSLFFVFAGKDMTYKNGPMMDLVWNEAGAYRGRVLYLGTLPRSQLYPIIKNAKAVVLPSRIDNLPNACLEAMLYGKIVVGTSGASFEQLIDDGENGFLCEIDNGHSLFNAVERALTLTMDEMERMGAAAKKRANCLTGTRAANKLTAVYRDVVYKCTSV